jgi:hypothetical protein
MNPAFILAIISLIEKAIEQEPQVAAALHDIFSKPNPTPSDWVAMRVKFLNKKYSDYVPASALPAADPATTPAAAAAAQSVPITVLPAPAAPAGPPTLAAIAANTPAAPAAPAPAAAATQPAAAPEQTASPAPAADAVLASINQADPTLGQHMTPAPDPASAAPAPAPAAPAGNAS